MSDTPSESNGNGNSNGNRNVTNWELRNLSLEIKGTVDQMRQEFRNELQNTSKRMDDFDKRIDGHEKRLDDKRRDINSLRDSTHKHANEIQNIQITLGDLTRAEVKELSRLIPVTQLAERMTIAAGVEKSLPHKYQEWVIHKKDREDKVKAAWFGLDRELLVLLVLVFCTVILPNILTIAHFFAHP